MHVVMSQIKIILLIFDVEYRLSYISMYPMFVKIPVTLRLNALVILKCMKKIRQDLSRALR